MMGTVAWSDLDSPLVVWGGRIMAIVGVFGWSVIPLFFAGIDILPMRHDAVLGLGAIIGAVFGGIGFAIVFKTNQYKKIKKEKQQSPCKAIREKGKHDWQEMKEQIKHTTYGIEFPGKCKECGKETIFQYSFDGEKSN